MRLGTMRGWFQPRNPTDTLMERLHQAASNSAASQLAAQEARDRLNQARIQGASVDVLAGLADAADAADARYREKKYDQTSVSIETIIANILESVTTK